MTVEVLLVDRQSDAHLIKTAVQEHSLDVKITIAKDTQTAAILLYDPGFNPRLVITGMHSNVEELFHRAEARHVPVVVFCSELSPPEVAEVLRLGAREYVPKPVQWDEFQEAVTGIVSRWVRPAG